LLQSTGEEAAGLAEGRRTGSVSRALGAAAVPAAALLLVRYLAEAAGFLVAPPAGALGGAALLVAAGMWLAPAWGRGTPSAGAPPARDVAAGVAWGAGGGAAVALLLRLTGGVRWQAPAMHIALVGAVASVAALGYAEESFLRGAAFRSVQTRAGDGPALWGSAVLLALVDLVAGAGVLAALTTCALGLWWGEARLRTGGFAFPAAAHAAWNVTLGPLLGIGGESAGARGAALFAAHLGPGWWAGVPGPAQGGLAAALVATALATAAVAGSRRAAARQRTF
jgi:membrane protease YdiL (CAAX protease family)